MMMTCHDAGLPEEWGAAGGFSQLKALGLGGNFRMAGTLPAAWGEPDCFPVLTYLEVGFNGLSGGLPIFRNPQLSYLSVTYTSLTIGDGASGFWNSTSPLSLLDLSNTPVSGRLPDAALIGFSLSLQALNVGNTSLHGEIPSSWLGSGGLLSRILFGGEVLWEASGRNQTWRKKVCIDRDYYETDAVAKKERVRDAVLAKLDQSNLTSLGVDLIPANALYWATNTTYIAGLCKNQDAPLVTGCLLGGFLAIVAAMLLIYFISGRKKKDESEPGCCSTLTRRLPTWCPGKMPEWLSALGKRAFALVGLGIYLVGLVTDIQVIQRVCGLGLWSGYVLLAIFSWHHIYRGLVVSFYLTRMSPERPKSERPEVKSNGQSAQKCQKARARLHSHRS